MLFASTAMYEGLSRLSAITMAAPASGIGVTTGEHTLGICAPHTPPAHVPQSIAPPHRRSTTTPHWAPSCTQLDGQGGPIAMTLASTIWIGVPEEDCPDVEVGVEPDIPGFVSPEMATTLPEPAMEPPAHPPSRLEGKRLVRAPQAARIPAVAPSKSTVRARLGLATIMRGL